MSVLAAGPVELSIVEAPRRAVIGGPILVRVRLSNGLEHEYPAPPEDGPTPLSLRLTDDRGRRFDFNEIARDQQLTDVWGLEPEEDFINAGESRDYTLDLSALMIDRPPPGAYRLSVHLLQQGVALAGEGPMIELIAPQVLAADWGRWPDAESLYGVVLRGDLGAAPVVAVGEAPADRPDLLVMTPVASLLPGATPQLGLPAGVDGTPPRHALALEGGAARLIPLRPGPGGMAEPEPPVPTGLGPARILGGVRDAQGAAWILADTGAPGRYALALATGRGLEISPLAPGTGGIAAAGALLTDSGPTLALIEAGPGGLTARYWTRSRGETRARALPAPAGRIFSLHLPAAASRHGAPHVDALVETGPEETTIARVPLLGGGAPQIAALPRIRTAVERWLWPDRATDAPVVLGAVGGKAAVLHVIDGKAVWGGRSALPLGPAPRLIAMSDGALWLVGADEEAGLRIDPAPH